MKKAIIIALLCLTMCGLCACNPTPTSKAPAKNHLLSIIDSTDGYDIYVENQTGIMYLATGSGKYGTSVIVMLDANGKPRIYKGGE